MKGGYSLLAELEGRYKALRPADDPQTEGAHTSTLKLVLSHCLWRAAEARTTLCANRSTRYPLTSASISVRCAVPWTSWRGWIWSYR